jgi:hypothetical protein
VFFEPKLPINGAKLGINRPKIPINEPLLGINKPKIGEKYGKVS